MSINENDDVELTSYTSESTAAAEAPVASERPALTVPGSAVGRRKEAVARVRLVPGSGPVSYTHLTLPTKRIV